MLLIIYTARLESLKSKYLFEHFAAGGNLFHIMAPGCVRRLAERAVLAGGTTSKLLWPPRVQDSKKD